MEELLHKYSLEEVCAMQWKQCVDKAADVLAEMPADRWIEVGYEDFVKDPETGLKEIFEFLGINTREDLIAKAVEGVSPRSIGKGRDQLGTEAIDRLGQLMEQTLVRYGYA
ncbi:MAG: sulfotransferase [Desulfobacteraceae bacterium]|nr:sulfotransferase [Desulfobacteraceae bacterium]